MDSITSRILLSVGYRVSVDRSSESLDVHRGSFASTTAAKIPLALFSLEDVDFQKASNNILAYRRST